MKNKLRLIIALGMVMSLLLINCEDDIDAKFDNKNMYGLPEVLTAEVCDVNNVAVCSVKTGGNVISEGNSVVIERGVCWSTMPNPTIRDNKTIDGSGDGTFSSDIVGLLTDTIYYLRAYATNSQGTAYGEQKTFITKESKDVTIGSINGHDYVDLGLPSGIKWATCNIGANEPYMHGNYYAWGEINTKSTYSSDNSVTHDMNLGDISGNLTYDAARANWGSTWRLPTKVEMLELLNYCTWDSIVLNDSPGFRVIGLNGNSIFLPTAGYYTESKHRDMSYLGRYCTSTSVPDSKTKSYFLHFKRNVSTIEIVNRSRYFGNSIRPVSD